MGRRLLTALTVLAGAGALAACGSVEELSIPGEDDPNIIAGAQIFDQRCAGCHTLDVTGSEGSAVSINGREYKDGPNFNQRLESYDQILYAIRNGGFSSGPMPQNIVVGREAEQVARFLEKYSGRQAGRATGPGIQDPAGEAGGLTPQGGEQGGE